MAKNKVSIEIELLDRISGNLDRLNRKLGETGRQSQQAKKEIESLDGVTDKLKKSLAALGVAFSMKEVVGKIVSVRGEMQQLQVAFETMLGSAEKANSLMSELVNTAATTPFGLEDVAQGAKQLLAYGLEAENVNETLVRLGDIAAGLSVPLNDLVYLYGTTMAQGRLYTQDLNQFTGRGIPMIQELAKQFGVAESKVKELVESGKVGFPEVQKVIESLTDEGGKFGGLMEAQSKTITGQISNIEDAIDMMFNDLGQQSEGLINDTLQGVSYVVEHYEQFGKVLLALAATWGTYRTAVMVAAAATQWASVAEAAHYNWLLLVEKAQKLLNATMLTNPYVLIATAVVGLVSAYIALKDSTTAEEKASATLSSTLERLKQSQQEYNAETERAIKTAADDAAATTDRGDAMDVLIAKYPEIIKKYIDEKGHLTDILKLKKEIAEFDGKKQREETVETLKNEGLSAWKNYNIARSLRSSQLSSNGLTQAEKRQATALREAYKRDAGVSAWSANEASLGDIRDFYKELAAQTRQKYNRTLTENRLSDFTKEGGKLEGYTDKQLQTLKKALLDNTGKDKDNTSIFFKGIGDYLTQQDRKNLLTRVEGMIKARSAEKKTSADWGASDKSSYESALKEYNDFLSDTSTKMTANEREKRRKELEEKLKAAKQGYHTPESNSEAEKQEKSAAKAEKAREKEQKAAEQRKQQEEQLGLELAETVRENESARIDAMDEGTDKALARIENDYEKRRNEIDKQESDWKKANKKAGIVTGEDGLTDAQRAALGESRSTAETTRAKAEEQVWKELLEKYQSYEQQRTAIREKYAKERASIEGSGLGDDVKSSALSELAKQEKAALKQVDDAELGEMEKENRLLVQLFEDTSSKSVSETEKIIKKVRLLLDYLSGTKDADGTSVVKDSNGNEVRRIGKGEIAGLGFSESGLKTLSESPEKLKALVEQYKALKRETLSKNPFKALADAVKDLFDKDANDLPLREKLKNLGTAAAESANLVKDFAGELSAMFEAAGDQETADMISGVSDAMGAVSNIAKSFADGGLINGISAAAGEAIGFVTSAFQASERHAAALKQIMAEVTAQQRGYNLLLLEQNLEMERAETIFGTDVYAKAANAVSVMREAYADLREEMAGTAEEQAAYDSAVNPWIQALLGGYSELKDAYSGLANIYIKTGHKKTGLFGWGKGTDLYSSILDVYPELVDEAGNLNRELAESVVSSREFKDNDKEALQYIIDLYDQAEEAWESVREYFGDIFGDLGSTLSDALVDAFSNGTDAAESFADSVGEMLENLAEQMIYTVTLSPYLEKAQEDMLSVMKDSSLTDEQKFQNYVSILSGMTDDVMGQQERFTSLLEEYRDAAGAKGLDLWQADSVTQSGKSGAFTTMTQDQGTKLEGMFTSGLQHWSSMDSRLETVAERMGSAESHLVRIAENTGLSASIAGELRDEFKKMVRDGLKVR